MIRVLKDHLTATLGQIETLIAPHQALAAQSARLRSVPAILALLTVCLPELGRRDHRKITNRALYIAAFIALRFDPAIRAFRKPLQNKGKPVNVAIIACARKRLTIFNAMARNGKKYFKRAG
jgi:transposase